REIRVALALERAHGDLEAAREPPIGTPQAVLVDRLALGIAQQVSRFLLVPAALAEQCHLGEYLGCVIAHAVPAGPLRRTHPRLPGERPELARLAREPRPGG